MFLDEQFYAVFGVPLLNKDEGPDSNDRKLWREIVRLSGKQYTLPGERVGTRFVNMLGSEIESSTAGRQSSDREFLFTSLILQAKRSDVTASSNRTMSK